MNDKDNTANALEAVPAKKISLEQMEHSYPQVSEKVALHAQQGDEETARYAAEHVEIDAATNKRLFWKINRRILVIMLVTYFCQSLDKGTLGFSSIMGIKADAHLVGQDVCMNMSIIIRNARH